MEERKINLLDLIADVLSHWRGMLVCMVIGSLLMAGFSYAKSHQYVKEGLEEEEETEYVDKITSDEHLNELEMKLKETEKVAVYDVLNDEHEYAQYQQHIDDSVMMKADPYNISRIVMIYKINMEDMGQSYMLRSVYEDLLNDVGVLQWVEKEIGISSSAADELIYAQSKSNIIVLSGANEADYGNDTLRVTILYSDDTGCKKLAKCVKEYIEQQHEMLAQEMGAHEVVLLSEAQSTVMDTTWRDRQINYSNTKINLLTSCAKAKEAFTEDQMAYYELLKGEDGILETASEAEEEIEAVPVVEKPSISNKYVLVGAVLFAFVYAGIFFVAYILNCKLRISDDLQELYHIPQLGQIVEYGGKKKFFVDRWIDALRNWNKRQFTREQSLELASTAIKISAQKQRIDTICLMGCNLKAGAQGVCDILKEKLEQENLSIMVLDNVLYDAEAMEKLGGASGIVLVEKAASTIYDEVTRELELASRQGIMVLGGVVVE